MRHLVKGRKLGRTAPHRRATLRSLAVALIYEHRIETTVAKAKELRGFVEPLITRAKDDTGHNRRQVFSKIQDKYAVTELFEEVGPAAKDRPGGYTRVIRTGFRQGDSSEMALVELVDFNDVKPDGKEGKKKRTRRAGKSKTSSGEAAEGVAEESKDISAGDEQDEADASEETTTAETGEEKETGQKEQVQSESSTDFTVDEVKQKLESMSPEDARVFVSGDERVTVQRALEQLEKKSEEK